MAAAEYIRPTEQAPLTSAQYKTYIATSIVLLRIKRFLLTVDTCWSNGCCKLGQSSHFA